MLLLFVGGLNVDDMNFYIQYVIRNMLSVWYIMDDLIGILFFIIYFNIFL